MPTYEYECNACGHCFEKFQSMMDKPVKKCPVCGKLKVQKLISSGAGVIFKGSGFYETDYKKKTGGADSKEPAKSGSETKSTDSAGKSEATAKTPAKSEN